MLRPQDTITRETKRLDGIWSFTADASGVGRTQQWWRAALPDVRSMPVPSSFNDVLVDPKLHDHVGDVWYQRDVFIPRGWDGQRVVLRFDAATHRATVWIDATLVAEHEGGYTPFEADVTTSVTPGEECRLTVVVNNELSWQSIPPGVVESLPGRDAAAAPVPRLLQLRRPPPQRLVVHDASRPHRRHHGGDRH